MREFTKEELQAFDGKDGKPSYLACNGKVYDVSESFLWKKGRHQALHHAGQDLTSDLSDAPHGEEMLSIFSGGWNISRVK